jgi:hypothetical protein
MMAPHNRNAGGRTERAWREAVAAELRGVAQA